MTQSVRETSPFERVVTLELTDTDINGAKAAAARRLSKDLRIPGFRPGKAPRPVVEAAIGAERLRSEAIEDLIPQRLGAILDEADLNPAVSPSLEKVDEIDGGVNVEVKVVLWPTIEALPAYQGREIAVESSDLSEDELEASITRMREQFASLETVDRPSKDGDFVSVDISAEWEGEPVEEASASELLYEIGSGLLIEGVDDHLRGTEAGATVSFVARLPAGFGDKAGEEANFAIKVNEVKAKILPDLDDEWVDEVTEFETVGELRAALSERIADMKRRTVANRFREKALDLLVDEAEVDLPERLIQAEMEDTLHRFVHRLETQDVTFEDYLGVTGMTEEQFLEDLRLQAERSLRTRIVLETVVRQEGIQIDPQELASTIEALAGGSERSDEVRRAFQDQARVLSLAGDILRNKAMEAVVAAARAVDGDGNPVDLALAETALGPEEIGGEVEAHMFEDHSLEGEMVDAIEGQIVATDEVEAEVVEAEIVDEEA